MKLSRRTLLATPVLLAVGPAPKPKLARFDVRLREALAAIPVDTSPVGPNDFIFRQGMHPIWLPREAERLK